MVLVYRRSEGSFCQRALPAKLKIEGLAHFPGALKRCMVSMDKVRKM